MDTIFLEGFSVKTTIGVTPEELLEPTQLVLRLRLGCDLSTATRSDRLEDTVDYAQLADEVDTVLSSRSFSLLEHAAQTVINHLFAQFELIDNIYVEIEKPGILTNVDRTGICLERSRN